MEHENIRDYDNLFQDYDLLWIPATRVTRYGRASGGQLYGIKLQGTWSNLVSFCKVSNRDLIIFKTGLHSIYIFPIYLNCNFWLEEFNRMFDFFSENQNLKICLVGDLNARVGNLQKLPKKCIHFKIHSVNRNSKDLVVNSNGRKLLDFFDNFGLVILNGRTEKDLNGEFTYISEVGCSMIDFIVDYQLFSDHMPIITSFSINDSSIFSNNNTLPLLPKLNWARQNLSDYQHKISFYLNSIVFVSNNWEEEVHFLTNIIKSASISNENNKRQIIRKNNWFDKDCNTARSKSFKQLKLFRKTNEMKDRLLYLNYNVMYKTLCRDKRKQYYLDCARQLCETKNSKEFWQKIKLFKHENSWTVGNVCAEDWLWHFKNLHNPSLITGRFSYQGHIFY